MGQRSLDLGVLFPKSPKQLSAYPTWLIQLWISTGFLQVGNVNAQSHGNSNLFTDRSLVPCFSVFTPEHYTSLYFFDDIIKWDL